MQGVEPAPGLVNAFGNEVGRAAELVGAEVAETLLGIWHGTGVEPHVNEIALADHLAAGVGNEEYVVHVRPVEIDEVIVLPAHVLRIESLVLQWIACHYPGSHGLLDFGIEFLYGAYAFLFLAVLRTPDRERCAPEAASREVPVLDVLQPFSETACSGGLRLPGDGLIELHHFLTHCGGLDEPAVERVVEHRLVRSPAMRIVVDVLLDAEGLALLLEHYAEVNVEGRVVRLEIRVICVLDEASGIFAVKLLIDIVLPVFGIHFPESEETALLVYLGREVAVSVLHPDARHSRSLGHAGVVRTECRGDVHDSGTVLGGHIVSEDDLESAVCLMLEPWDELVV